MLDPKASLGCHAGGRIAIEHVADGGVPDRVCRDLPAMTQCRARERRDLLS
jgi:hypothetical protein